MCVHAFTLDPPCSKARVSKEPTNEVTAKELDAYKLEMADLRRVVEKQNRTIEELVKAASSASTSTNEEPRSYSDDGFELGMEEW